MIVKVLGMRFSKVYKDSFKKACTKSSICLSAWKSNLEIHARFIVPEWSVGSFLAFPLKVHFCILIYLIATFNGIFIHCVNVYRFEWYNKRLNGDESRHERDARRDVKNRGRM